MPGATLAVNFEHKAAWDLERLEPNTFFPIASCVAFAERVGENAEGAALAGLVERWEGRAGADDVRRVSSGITDTSVSGDSLYAGYARQGAPIRPRRLFFVEEIENPSHSPSRPTITVNPRRGGQDKTPWRDLDLTAITEQTIESKHVYDVYLNETLVPYATLEPLKAILPVKTVGRIRDTNRLKTGRVASGWAGWSGCAGRWQTISRLWDDNKAAASQTKPAGQLGPLRQIVIAIGLARETQRQAVPRCSKSKAGATNRCNSGRTITLWLTKRLYWITCKDMQEANYLLAIINSDTLYEAVQPLMSKGQFGARHLHKQLWKLPIPEFDPNHELHITLSQAGEQAASAASTRLSQLQAERSKARPLTVTIARRELRAWLRNSAEGAAVEGLVGRLLGGG